MLEQNFQSALTELKDLVDIVKNNSAQLETCILQEKHLQQRIQDKEGQLQSIQDLDSKLRTALKESQQILQEFQAQHIEFVEVYATWFEEKETSFGQIETQYALMSNEQESKHRILTEHFKKAFDIINTEVVKNQQSLAFLNETKDVLAQNIKEVEGRGGKQIEELLKKHGDDYKILIDTLQATEQKLQKKLHFLIIVASCALILAVLGFFL